MSAVIAPRGAPGPGIAHWVAQNRMLATALGVSIALHALLLTIRFVAPQMLEIEAKDPGLEVVLVNTQSRSKPTKADVLAQVALDGGGDKDQGRASTPLPNVNITREGDSLQEARRRLEELDAEQKKLLAALKSKKPIAEPKEDRKPTPEAKPEPTADVVDSARALASKLAIIDQRIQEEYKRPKKHFYGVSANDYVAALYIENFRNKVERWGNLNYPDAARGKLYGQVQVTVVIDREGLVYSMELNKSSGHKVLDQAALDIVRRAAPFGRFTQQMTQEMDLLSVTRTMIFTNDALETRGGR